GLSGRLVLRAPRRSAGLRRPRARRARARPRALERAGFHGERALPGLRDLPGDGLLESAALLRAAALRRGRRDDAAHLAHVFLSLEPQARGRGRVPRRGRGGVAPGLEVVVRRVAPRDAAHRLPIETRGAATTSPPGRPLAYDRDHRAQRR